MRPHLCAVLIVLSFGPGVSAQRPSDVERRRIQELLEQSAQRSAEELEGRAKATTVGALNAEANLWIRRLDEAIRTWKKERGAGAAPLLAEGVLLDCLGRLQGVRTRLVSTEVPLPPPFITLSAQRPARAAKAFDAALKLDPHLTEARMRAARIRAASDAGAALELERMAGDQSGSPLAYLAAISLAETARAQQDVAGAIRWYQRALEIHPRSTAATIGLSSLKPSAALSFDALDPGDLYYSYPCTILTADVNAALSARVRQVVLK